MSAIAQNIVCQKLGDTYMEEFLNFLEKFHFNLGDRNFKLFMATTDQTSLWEILVDESQNKVIGTRVTISVDEIDLSHHYLVAIDPDYQGQGLTKMFRDVMKGETERIFSASSNIHSLRSFAKQGLGKVQLNKQISFRGIVNQTVVKELLSDTTDCQNNVAFCEVTVENIDQILDYDKHICLFDRQKLLRRWMLNEFSAKELYEQTQIDPDQGSENEHRLSTTIAAVEGSKYVVRGYACLRYCYEGNYTLQPVYADTNEIAWQLMLRVLQRLGRAKIKVGSILEQKIDLTAQMDKSACEKLAKQFHLKVDAEAILNVTANGEQLLKQMQLDKAYSVFEIFPI